jgi:hypothetical protein
VPEPECSLCTFDEPLPLLLPFVTQAPFDHVEVSVNEESFCRLSSSLISPVIDAL